MTDRSIAREASAPVPFKDELVLILSTLLERSTDAVLADEGHYAGLVSMDELHHCRAEMNGGQWANWNSMRFDADDPNNFVYARTDFNLRHTMFEVLPVDDPAVRRLWEAQGGVLLGSQIAALVDRGDVSSEQAAKFPPYFACIESPPTLLHSLAHLFRLHAYEERIAPPGMDTYELDPQWRPLLEQITNSELREYLGLFFQGGYDSTVGMSFMNPTGGAKRTLPGPYVTELAWEDKDDVKHYLVRRTQ